jgi:spermidine/putrescine transport system permease protein
MIYSFQDTQYIHFGSYGELSFNLYAKLFENEEIMTALWNTVLIAVASAVVATILGTIGAIGIHYSKRKVKNAVDMMSQIPVVNAEIVTALALTILFVAVQAEFSFLTLLIGHVVLTVPFVVLNVIPKLKQMDVNTYEAALDLGATPTRALFQVIIPEILPGVFSGFMLSITLSLDDYIITAFTRDDSFQTLSTYIYGVTAKGPLPAELRAFTTLFVFSVAIIIVSYNFYKSYKLRKKGMVGGK